MKKKIISILLACFIFISSSASCFAYENKNIRLADGGIISAPMVAVVATLAVGTGVVLNSNDDIINFANMFYNKNKENWEDVNNLFKTCVSIGANKVVSVGREFKDLVINFLDSLKFGDSFGTSSFIGEIEVGKEYSYYDHLVGSSLEPYVFEDVFYVKNGVTYPLAVKQNGSSYYYVGVGYIDSNGDYVNINNHYCNSFTNYKRSWFKIVPYTGDSPDYNYSAVINYSFGSISAGLNLQSDRIGVVDTVTGVYDKSHLADKVEGVEIYVPGNVGDLVGVGNPGDVYYNPSLNPPYDLPADGIVSVPGVSNPSIDVDNSVSIPNTGVNDGVVEGNPDFDFSFPSFGDSINFEPLYATGITEKFPFSLPWDIQRIIGVFNVKAVAPKFEVPLLSEKIELDLTKFDELASIVRFFVLIGFIACLIFISTRLMG